MSIDEKHLRDLILEVSNTSHDCGAFDIESDYAGVAYDELLEKACEAEARLFDYVLSCSKGR